ncbi:MAG: ArsR/SmtB family transcription factor [Chloroflexota bacterium]
MRDWPALAKAYRALGQPVRLKIIAALAAGELCVCELEQMLALTQPAISQHLKVLKEAGLVAERREGQWSLQSLVPDQLCGLLADLQALARGAGMPDDDPDFRARLAAVRARPPIQCHDRVKPDWGWHG